MQDDSETVAMIKELLETRIRPAVQDDGGDIEFREFDEWVSLSLKVFFNVENEILIFIYLSIFFLQGIWNSQTEIARCL